MDGMDQMHGIWLLFMTKFPPTKGAELNILNFLMNKNYWCNFSNITAFVSAGREQQCLQLPMTEDLST